MADILNTGIVPMEKDTLMRNILKIGVAALVVAGMVSPAFAHGGGGYWRCEPQNVKAAAAANVAACSAHTHQCMGFGQHYYGK